MRNTRSLGFDMDNRHSSSIINHDGFAGYAVEWSPFYEDLLATASSSNFGIVGNGRLYVFSKGAEPKSFDTQDGIFDLAFSEIHDKQLITGCGDGAIQLWDWSMPKYPLALFREHAREVFSVNWNLIHKNHFVSCSWDSSIKLWDPSHSNSIKTWIEHSGAVYSVVCSPKLQTVFASASSDSSIKIWDDRSQSSTNTFFGHSGEILSIDWNKYEPNVIVSGSVDRSLKVWDLRNTSSPRSNIIGHDLAIRRVKCSPHSGNIVATASYDGNMKLFDISIGREVFVVDRTDCHLWMGRQDTNLPNLERERSLMGVLNEISVSIASNSNVMLETRIKYGEKKDVAVVLSHPYGPLGGDFEHPIISLLYNYFAHQGCMAVKFNFRGVGASTGRTSYQGQGEVHDVLSVVNYVKKRSDLSPKYFLLVGYSYGCIANGGASPQIPDCIGFIAISYPCGVSWALTLWNSKKYSDAISSMSGKIPKLFIMGENDNFSSLSQFDKFTKSIADPKTVLVVKDMDHFWTNREDTLLGHIKQWMAKHVDLKSYSKSLNSLSVTTSVSDAPSAKVSPASVTTKGKASVITKTSPSADVLNYSRCQESIEIIDKLRLEELIDVDLKPKAKSDDYINKVSSNDVFNPSSSSTLSNSANALKPMVSPTRKPPPVPKPAKSTPDIL